MVDNQLLEQSENGNEFLPLSVCDRDFMVVAAKKRFYFSNSFITRFIKSVYTNVTIIIGQISKTIGFLAAKRDELLF